MILRGSRRPGSSGRRGTRLARLLAATATAVAALGAVVVPGAGSTGAVGAPDHPLAYAAASSPVAPAAAAPSVHPSGVSAGVSASVPAVVPAKNTAVIVLQTMTPAVVKPGSDLSVTGTVTAPSDGPLSAPEVRIVRGEVPVRQTDALDDWAAGRTRAVGRIVSTTRLPTVPAGHTQAFSATVPWDRLRSQDAFAALPIAVDVFQQGATEPTGSTRTFVAWNSRKEYVPLDVATVLPVTLDPAVALFSRSDAVRLRAWQGAIGPASRVTRIIEGTRSSPVDLAVDPSVLGGFVATIGDTVVDGSARHRLEILKERLVLPEATATSSGTSSGTSAGTPTGTTGDT